MQLKQLRFRALFVIAVFAGCAGLTIAQAQRPGAPIDPPRTSFDYIHVEHVTFEIVESSYALKELSTIRVHTIFLMDKCAFYSRLLLASDYGAELHERGQGMVTFGHEYVISFGDYLYHRDIMNAIGRNPKIVDAPEYIKLKERLEREGYWMLHLLTKNRSAPENAAAKEVSATVRYETDTPLDGPRSQAEVVKFLVPLETTITMTPAQVAIIPLSNSDAKGRRRYVAFALIPYRATS